MSSRASVGTINFVVGRDVGARAPPPPPPGPSSSHSSLWYRSGRSVCPSGHSNATCLRRPRVTARRRQPSVTTKPRWQERTRRRSRLQGRCRTLATSWLRRATAGRTCAPTVRATSRGSAICRAGIARVMVSRGGGLSGHGALLTAAPASPVVAHEPWQANEPARSNDAWWIFACVVCGRWA